MFLKFRSKCNQTKKNNSFLELAFENVPDALFIKNENSVIVRCNQKFLELFPPEKRDKVIGHTMNEDFDPEEAKAYLEEDRKAFREGYTKTIETICFPNGKTKTMSTQKTRFENSSGERFILGIATDITDQIKLQKETEESQSMLRMITDFFPGLVFVKDKNFNLIYANSVYISKYPINEQANLIGTPSTKYYNLEQRDEIVQQDNETIKKGYTVKKKMIDFPNGERMNAIVTKRCFADRHGNDYILGIITENELD